MQVKNKKIKLLFFILILVFFKVFIENYSTIYNKYLTYQYNSYFSNNNNHYKRIELSEFINIIEKKNDKFIIFLGRSSCSDCVQNINKIKNEIKKFNNEIYEVYYLDLDEIKGNDLYFKEYDNILSKLKIFEIPVFIVHNETALKKYDI